MYRNTLLRAMAAVTLGVAVIGASAVAAGTSPFLGTWVLNISQSPNSGYTSETLTVTDAAGGSLHVTIDGTRVNGATSRMEYTAAGDNKSVPVTGSADVDAAKIKLNGNAVTYAFLKAGKRLRWGTLTVSANGKSMHGSVTTAMADGKRVKSPMVFDRQ
ncbi:MAG TPA: hypothetical protein VMF64_11775 [Steroidobacteraceae bacterium]|nr:hypothetical protein [Steroidobacteraceae bacterium]